jgi:hypothetical protein
VLVLRDDHVALSRRVRELESWKPYVGEES